MLKIPNIQDYYVSEEGHIISTKTGHGCHGYKSPHQMKEHINKDGYKVTYLTINGKTKTFSVHRLIASAQIGRELTKWQEVNHIDLNPQNNRPQNLEVLTNEQHHLLHKSKKRKFKDC